MRIFDECDYLIHLVRCAIHDLQPSELPDGLKFEVVFEWGRFHHVANIAFYSVEKLMTKPEPSLYHKWQRYRDQAVVREINQSYAAQELRESLQMAGIRALEVQGTRIKPLYPQPDFRIMSDLDFIIDRTNLLAAKNILENLGYGCPEAKPGEVNAHRPPNIHVEMHTAFFAEDSQYRHILQDPFVSVDENGQCDVNTFYLYNILHIAKHYFYGGCGIRRVLDVYYLNRAYGQRIDRDEVHAQLAQANLTDFASQLSDLANVWFGEDGQDLAESKIAHHIKTSGLHGTWQNLLERDLKKELNQSHRFPKATYFLRRLFSTGKDLCVRYPILERHKLLYPLCWLHRLLYALRPKERKRVRREIKTVMNMKDAQ